MCVCVCVFEILSFVCSLCAKIRKQYEMMLECERINNYIKILKENHSSDSIKQKFSEQLRSFNDKFFAENNTISMIGLPHLQIQKIDIKSSRYTNHEFFM